MTEVQRAALEAEAALARLMLKAYLWEGEKVRVGE